jgi:hypothetical protein
MTATAAAPRPRRTEPVTVRFVDGQVQLTCACGLRITQAVRAAIAERCIDPKCGRPWR